jgi:hypothetical protein
MSMAVCPRCHGSGSVTACLVHGRHACGLTWCRICYGKGLIRLPDEDDDQEEELWRSTSDQRKRCA